MNRAPRNSSTRRTAARAIKLTTTRARLVAIFASLAVVLAVAVIGGSSAKSTGNDGRDKIAGGRTSDNSPKRGNTLRASAAGATRRAGATTAPNLPNDGTPVITTDKDTYAPGEPITFTGANWSPGETVSIVVGTDAAGGAGLTLEATADDAGAFTVSGMIPETTGGAVATAAAKASFQTSAAAPTSVQSSAAPAATTQAGTTYTATATGSNSGASAQLLISVVPASVHVPTPGCGAVLTPDVVDFLRGKPNDPVEDYEAWRQDHPNMVELPMPLQCRSEAWRVLHGLMEEPATQAPEPESAASSPFVGDAVAGPDGDMGGGVSAYQGELNIAIDPNNPLHLVAGANSFYRDPSAACQSPTGGSGSTYGTQALYGSTDGGQTWTYKCAPWNPSITGGISGATAWFGSDPAMAWDNAGNAYAVYMLVNQNSAGTSSGSAIVIAKSTDSGTTWSNLGIIVNHETVANPFDDKEMVVVDNTVGQANSHTGRIYVIWDENNVERVAYSDNGSSWTTVVMGSGTEIGGNIAVGPDGTVWAAWNHYSQTGGVGAGDSLYVKKSTDGGVTWTAPAANPIVQHNLASFGSNNKPAAQDSRGINAFPIIDVDRNPASPFYGRIYVAYSDFPPSTGSGNDLNVYLVSSGNGGASWSSQVLANDDGGTSTQIFPWMNVDQSDGTVNLSWLDTRNFSANNRQTQTYTARSINGGASFEPNVSVEDTGANFRNNVSYSDDNTTDNSARNGNQYGDYEGVVAANRISHPLWTDTRNFFPSADTASPARAEDAVTTTLTNCSAPSSVAAPTTSSSGCGLIVSWSAPAGWGTSATGGTYSVYRSTTSTFPGGMPLASGLTTTSYTDTTGTPGITYYYFVAAKNNCPGTSLTPMSTVSAGTAVVFPACGPSGTLQGTVTTGGNPVNGAAVSTGTLTVTTNASGFYQFPSVPVGTYTVTASAAGYNTATANNVSVTQNTTTVQNFSLTVGTTSNCFTDTTQSDFAAGTANNVDASSSPGNVKLATTGGGSAVDQQQTTASTTGFGTNNTTWVAQGFVAGVSGSLTSVNVQEFYSSGTAGSLVVEIHNAVGSGSAATPGTTVLATSGSVPVSSGAISTYNFSFSSPPSLTAGTTYFIVVHDASGTTATYGTIIACRTTGGGCNPYTNGTAYTNGSSGSGAWTSQPTDLYFQTNMQTATTFAASGDLTSSVKDANPVFGATPTWTTLSWTATTPSSTAIKFQAAGSNSSTGPFTFVGPDGTSATFFTTTGASLSQFNGFRYLKYKAFLSTSVNTSTPTLADVTVCDSDVPLPSTTLSVSNASGTYGGTTNLSATLTSGGNPISGKSISFTLNGASVGSVTTNASGVASLSNVSLAGINAGSYANGVGASFATDSSYSGSSGSGSLTVSKATPTITWNSPANIVYGTALSATQLNATASVPGSFAYTPAAGTVLHAGNAQTLHADFTPTDTTNYNVASKDVSINVTKATLTVTADNQSRAYGAPNPSLTYTMTGFVNSDTQSSATTGQPSITTTANSTSAPGGYTITAALGTLASNDYQFSFVNGTLTVTKANQTINFGALATRTYGDADFNVSATASSGLAVSFAAGGNCTVSGSTVHLTGAGSCTVTASQAGDTNYNAAPNAQQSFTINKADSTTTVTAGNATYNGQPHGATATATGFGGLNQTLTVTYTGRNSTTYGPSTTAPTNAGDYTASASFAGDNDHNGSSGSADYTIAKANAVISVTPYSTTYDGASHTAAGTATGVESPSPADLSLLLDLSGTTHTGAGSYATDSWSFAGNNNYNAAAGTVSDQIDKASSSVSVSCPASQTYTGSAIEPCAASYSGAGGLSGALTPTYSDNVNAGTATASASYAGDANHNGSSDSKNFTIDKAASTTTITCPASVTYNGSAVEPCSATVTGAGGLSQSAAVSYTNNTNAGTASASATYDGDANHTGSSDSKTFVINKASSTTAIICPASVTYTGSAQTPCSAAVTGAGGLSQPLTVNYANNTNAGTADASASYAGDANHEASNDSKTFEIAPASTTTVITCSASENYTGSAITPCTVSVTGANLSLSPAPVYINNVNAGTASASYTYAGDANHTGSADTKTFQIAPAASITILTFEAGPYVYRGSAFNATANVNGAGGLNSPVAVVYTGDCTNVTTTNGCTATATYAGDANHAGSADTKSITITKATATISLSDLSQTYTGAPRVAAATTNPTGLSGVSVTYNGSTSAPVNAGSYAVVASLGNTNYQAEDATGTLTVGKAAPVVAAGGNTCTYSGSPCAGSGTATGVDGSNLGAVTLTYTPGGTAPANAGSYTVVASIGETANHTAGSSAPAAVTINKAAPTVSVTVPSGTVTYDGNAHAATGFAYGVGGASDVLTPAAAFTYNGDAGAPVNVGSYAVVASFAGNDNYLPATNSSAGITIGQAVSTTAVAVSNATYDGGAHGGSASFTGAGGLSGSLTVTYTGRNGTIYSSTTAPTNAGDYTASAAYAGDANHSASSDSKDFRIAKANAVISVTLYSVNYDGYAHTATGTAKGVLNESLSGLNLSGTTHTAAGTYNGDAWTFTDSTGNYNDANGTVNDLIGAAGSTTTVTVSNATYNGQPHGASATVTGAGSLSQSLTVTYSGHLVNGASYGPTTTAPTSAGSYTASATYAGDANHTGSTDSKSFQIAQATATLSLSNLYYLYDGQPHAAAATTNPAGLSGVSFSYAGQTLSYNSATPPVAAGTYTVTASLSNNDYAAAPVSATFVINAAPAVTITGPASGAAYAKGSTVSFAGTFVDNPGVHTATWTIQSGVGAPVTVNGVVNEATGAVTGSYTFASAGVYTLTLTVTDNFSVVGSATTVNNVANAPALVAVYDPSSTGGSVSTTTKSPLYNSLAGWYLPNLSLTGTATTGFNASYPSATATAPTGQAVFNFAAANLSLSSLSYRWMVVSKPYVWLRGTGTVNNVSGYEFLISAVDGQLTGGGGSDKFRIRIWKASDGTVVYDNMPNTALNAAAVTVTSNGDIAIK